MAERARLFAADRPTRRLARTLLLIGTAGACLLPIGPRGPALAQTINGAVPPTEVPTGTVVSVTGDGTPALLSQGDTGGVPNGIVVVGGGGITASNLSGTSIGVVSALAGGTIDLGTGTLVQAEGSGSPPGIIGATGLLARDLGTGGLIPTIIAKDLTVIISSDKPYGVYANTDSVITLTGLTTIKTFSNGTEGWGLLSNAKGKLTAENADITMGGLGGTFGQFQVAIGAFAGGQTTVTGNTTFNVTGLQTEAIVAFGAGSLVTLNNVAGIAVGTFEHATGAVSFLGGTITVGGAAQLTVSGATRAFGLQVFDGGTVGFLGSSKISVTAPEAFGLSAKGGGTIVLNNGTVVIDGAKAAAIHSEAPAAATPTSITVKDSILTSSGDGIVIRGGTTHLTFANVTLSNASGLAIDVAANAGAPGTLNFTADASQLTGRAVTEAGSVSTVVLRSGTIWNLTGDSNLTNLTNDASSLLFSPPIGGVFRTLTTVNYVGAGGTLGLHTFLGTDGSPSDKLAIRGGAATGFTSMLITNAFGPGAQTFGNGILVVDAQSTTAPGAFALGKPVVAGPYQYQLFRGSKDASAPESWFLRSTLDCGLPSATSPPCPTPGPGPEPGPGPGPVPNFRQEASLYAALPALALLYGRALLDSLHQRVGEQEHLRGRADLTGTAYANGAWGRVIAQHGSRDGDPKGVFGAGPRYDFDFAAIQAGLDVYRWQQVGGARIHAGFYAALGSGRADVAHFDGTAAGRDYLAAYSIGGYWTYFGPMGWYLDGVVQGTWYDMKGQSTRLPALETSGWGFAASLEGGIPFKMGGGWILEPQAQIVYQGVSLGDGADTAATVRFDDIESLAGRVGVRIAKTWPVGGPHQPSLVTAWFRPSLWQEFSGDPRTLFSSEAGFIPFRADLGEAWLELNGGITAQIDRFTALYANTSYHIGIDGRSDAWDGKVGLRVNW